MSDDLIRTKTERFSKQVESSIAGARQNASRFAKRPKLQAMMLDGYMPRSALIRLCRNLNSRELDDIIQMLVDAELIGISEADGNEVYWSR